MNKCLKKIFFLLIILLFFYSFTNIFPVYALDLTKADAFITKGAGKQGIQGTALTEIGSNFSDIGQVLVFIGAGVLVGGMAYLGIMYMVSSPEKQGKLKQQLIGLVVAGVVIFGAYSIWSILVSVLSGIMGG